MEISELQSKIDQLQYELNVENQRGGLKNGDVVARLEKEIAELKVELDKPEVDPVIARGEEEIELFGVPLGAYFATIADHVAVRSVVIPAFRQLIKEKQEREDGYHKLSEKSEAESERLSEIIEARDTEISALKAALYESQLLAADNATKRDNAYNELLDAKNTIDDLNAKLAAATAPKESVRTNLDGAEVVEKVKRVIYDVEYTGKWKEKFTAKYADTDESFEDYVLYKATKYTEVTAEAAIPFRTEYLDAQQPEVVEEDHPYDIPDSTDEVAYTAPAFRGEDENAAEPGLATEAPAVAGSPVTREEFEELKARVEQIESVRSAA